MIIEHTITPNPEDIDCLTQGINAESAGYGTMSPFGFFIRNEEGDLIAGCNGSIIFDAIYTSQLWVHPDHRHQGLGRKLMERVHAYGRQSSCTLATLATRSFLRTQAFYERLGYVCDFESQGYVRGTSRLFLKKTL